MGTSKNTKKQSNNKIRNEYEKLSWLYYIPLLLIAGFVPLIVRGKYVNLTDSIQRYYWTGQVELLDFFSYWKAQWVIILTGIALFIYITLAIMKMAPFKKLWQYYIPMGIYAFFVILSTIFAVDLDTALNGFMDMYQGMWVLLSYVTITFLVINFVNTERNVRWFLNAFIFLTIVEGLIGVGQYFGFDIFNTPFGNSLIVPWDIKLNEPLTFNFGKFTIYGTLFNTNFVGSFAALMLPMCVVYLVYADKWWTRTIGGIALALGVFTWFGCNSRAGYLAVAVEIIVAAVFLRHYIVKYWKVSATVVVVGLVALIGFNAVSGGRLWERLESLNLVKALQDAKENGNVDGEYKEGDPIIYKSIEIDGDVLKIDTNKRTYYIKATDDDVYFVDELGQEVESVYYEEHMLSILPGDGSKGIRLFKNNSNGLFCVSKEWSINNTDIMFYYDGIIRQVSTGGRIVDIIEPNFLFLFNGLEKIASNRGYIWGTSIPILNKTLFIGNGPDTFPIVFPQNDVVKKVNTGMSANTVVDKPHNMYLQIGINTGVISFISLLIIWIIYIVKSNKTYWKYKVKEFERTFGFACFIAIAGYLFAGIFNDHIVSVSPLFWIILGLGISANIRLNEKEIENA